MSNSSTECESEYSSSEHGLGFSCVINPCNWFRPQKLHPKVMNLFYWRDVKKSGVAFGTIMVILMSLAYVSVISVLAYSSLALLSATLGFTLYKKIMNTVQKTQEGHPLQEYLDIETEIPEERAQQVAEMIVSKVNCYLRATKNLFLVSDLFETLKFGAGLWFLTYVGSWFNGLTLVILAVLSAFTLPKLYEQNKEIVDQYLDIAYGHINNVQSKIKAAIPMGGNKEKEQ